MSSLSFKKPWDAARFRAWYKEKYDSTTLPVYSDPSSRGELCVVIPSDCEYSPLVLAAQFCKESHPEHLEVSTFPCAECGHQHLLKDIDLDMIEPTCRWCLSSEYEQDPLGNYIEEMWARKRRL